MVDSAAPQGKSWTFLKAIPFVLIAILLFEIGGWLYQRIQDPQAPHVTWLIAILFVLSLVFFVLANWREVFGFFRAIQIGIVVLSFVFLGSTVGVLVPQIESFEDPQERVNAHNYVENYDAFKWAVGYFTYHVIHPYGLGMPKVQLPARAIEGLEKLGKKYGRELAENRRKEMSLAFDSNAKNQAIGEHIQNNEGVYKGFFDLCTMLDFNRAYKSEWFLGIMTLLFFCVLSNTFRFGVRALFTKQRFGFLVSHCGVMTILIGGAISKAFTERGIMHMNIGSASSRYWAYFDLNKPRDLPFLLHLDDFRRDDWDKISIFFLDEDFKSVPPSYTVWPGYQLSLDYAAQDKPRYLLQVREAYPTVQVSEPILHEKYTAEDALPFAEWNPILKCRLGDQQKFLYARGRLAAELAIHPENHWKIRYVVAANKQEALAALQQGVQARLGVVHVRIGKDEQAWQQSVEIKNIGQKIALGQGYSMEVLNAIGQFRMVMNEKTGRQVVFEPDLPLEQQPTSALSSIKVRIVQEENDVSDTRWVLNNIDDEALGFQSHHAFQEVFTKLEWDDWSSPTQQRYLILDIPDEALQLVPADKPEQVQEITLGQALQLSDGSSLVVEQRVKLGEFSYDFVAENKEDFFQQGPPGIVLDVQTPNEFKTLKLAAVPGADRALIDGKLGIVFLEDDQALPFEWQSRIAVLESSQGQEPRVVAQGNIRVNDYFSWRGWHFFQTNAMKEDPSYSGIGVVYDPGIPLVVNGMYILIFGVAWALFRRLGRRKEV